METKIKAQPIETKPRAEERPDTFPRGRVCSRPGCKTVLSIYSRGPRCNPCIFSRDQERGIGSMSLAELLEEAP